MKTVICATCVLSKKEKKKKKRLKISKKNNKISNMVRKVGRIIIWKP
jgi:hypothetical protein